MGHSIWLPALVCAFPFLSLLCVILSSSLSNIVYFYSSYFLLICNIALLLLSLSSFSPPPQSFYQRCSKACLKSELCFAFAGIILYKE